MNESLLKKELKKAVWKYGLLYNTQKISAIEFFTKVDDFIKSNKEFIFFFLRKIKKDFPKGANIIVSGEFGRLIKKHKSLFGEEFNIIYANGRLRQERKVISLKKYRPLFNQKPSVFSDDSYCYGTTYSKIKKEVEKNGGKIEKAYVIYYNPKTGLKINKPKELYTFFNFFKDFREYFTLLKKSTKRQTKNS
ncbi:MAG: hypothetical protein WCI72_05350 [archaeon]